MKRVVKSEVKTRRDLNRRLRSSLARAVVLAACASLVVCARVGSAQSSANDDPPGLADMPLRPDTAKWVDSRGTSMALLMYDDLRASATPREDLLDFLESSYQAGAELAGWDRSLTER